MTSIGLFGCGGIGVEFLHSLKGKNVSKLLLVDFDTVELSNLSRQFIFTKEDIGKSKVEACRRFCLANFKDAKVLTYDSHLEDIPLSCFYGLEYIVAALDNAQSRRVLQVRAIGSGSTFIDSGTAGLSGSVRVFKHFSCAFRQFPANMNRAQCERPRCYCCSANDESAALPVCTLRYRPETPKHCIAFALALGKGFQGEGELLEVKVKGIPYVLAELFAGKFENNADPLIMKCMAVLLHFTPSERFFDRDSTEDVRFVHAVAVLRARQFDIPYMYSEYETQYIAGRIISAVCFANGLIGALTVREIFKPTTPYILVSKNAPHVRKDELGDANCECPVCGVDTYKVELVKIDFFLATMFPSGYYMYYDNKCVRVVTTEEESGWFEEEPDSYFKIEVGYFLCAVKNDFKINIIIGGSGSEFCWTGRYRKQESVDIIDSDELSIVQEV